MQLVCHAGRATTVSELCMNGLQVQVGGGSHGAGRLCQETLFLLDWKAGALLLLGVGKGEKLTLQWLQRHIMSLTRTQHCLSRTNGECN